MTNKILLEAGERERVCVWEVNKMKQHDNHIFMVFCMGIGYFSFG